MSLRSALNEFNAQAGPLKALFAAVAEVEQYHQQADELGSLNTQLEQVRNDLASERDMLASAQAELADTLDRTRQAVREASTTLSSAQARADELLTEAKAQADTLVREATLDARRKQQSAEKELDAVCTQLDTMKKELAALQRQVRHAQDANPEEPAA